MIVVRASTFQEKIGFQQEDKDHLIIPRFSPLITYHPLEAADKHSASLMANIFSTLVTLDAASWEYENTHLLLYLREDVSFHDGSVLKAEDVMGELKKMKEEPHFKKLWEPVTSFSSPAPLVVRLDFPAGCSYILQLLSTLNASIYKEVNGKLTGTGSFYIAEESQKSLFSAPLSPISVFGPCWTV
ncbi:ABC transporter substrate-binding protein [Peribacillus kribbensis]|uniref:ABC transporter substrate-binding protein n=1 Tax=Peribacillus kribbensis TaxID=356658 RepID=UPI000418A71D|nr:ABC transporter substrate-binding protein [Peribacillus kribbensis]